MERAVAEGLVREFLALSAPLNQMTQLSSCLPEEEAKQVRRVLGDSYGRLYTDLILPIVAQYPDLDPDPPASSMLRHDT